MKASWTSLTEGLASGGGDKASWDPLQFRPVKVTRDNWVFFIRIQKTGSQTLWNRMVEVWDGTVWGKSSKCTAGMFCGANCLGRVKELVHRFYAGLETCKMFVRGHIGVYDYREGLKAVQGGKPSDVIWITMLRDPVKRVISEFVHVTHNLVAEFGEDFYGKAWDYTYKGEKEDIMDFLSCEECQVGASNRQTRMLAGLYTTGADEDVDDEVLLALALKNLESCAFVGLMERYTDSMLLLRRTFDKNLQRFSKYTYRPHPYDGSSRKLELSEEAMAKIKELNRLDLVLYARAREIFEARFNDMLLQASPEDRNKRFLPGPKGVSFTLKVDPSLGEEAAVMSLDDEEEEQQDAEKWRALVAGMKPYQGKGEEERERDKYRQLASIHSARPVQKEDQQDQEDEGTGELPVGAGHTYLSQVLYLSDESVPPDAPYCRPSTIQQVDDYDIQRADPLGNIPALSGSILGRYEDVSACVARQLCKAVTSCQGFVHDASKATATLIDFSNKKSPVELNYNSDVLYTKRKEMDDDSMVMKLGRFDRMQLLQVASARDTQGFLYPNLHKEKMHCQIEVPLIDPNDSVHFEVYEPTMGLSHYQIFKQVESGGSCRAKLECAQLPQCAGFLLSVRDGNAFLFRWLDPARLRVNMVIREAITHGGDGIIRTFIKVNNRDGSGEVTTESELTFPPYYFTPIAETKIGNAERYPQPAGVVVSLTTIPSRIEHIRPTLLSLLTQTLPPDEILLCLPSVSLREPAKPYVIPQWLNDMDKVRIIKSKEDYGPSTKLIPAVQELRKVRDNHLVIVVDDDTQYPPRLIETFVQWHHALPSAALALRGWVVNSEIVYLKFTDNYLVFGNEVEAPHPVSVMTANCAYAVQTAFFDRKLWQYKDVPDGARWMDDVWISGNLARRGVPRLVVPFDENTFTWNSWLPTLTLDQIRLRREPKYQRYRGNTPREAANNQALTYFMDDWDVMWDVGYRVYSPRWAITRYQPKITSDFAGVNVMRGGVDAEDPESKIKRMERNLMKRGS